MYLVKKLFGLSEWGGGGGEPSPHAPPKYATVYTYSVYIYIYTQCIYTKYVLWVYNNALYYMVQAISGEIARSDWLQFLRLLVLTFS